MVQLRMELTTNFPSLPENIQERIIKTALDTVSPLHPMFREGDYYVTLNIDGRNVPDRPFLAPLEYYERWYKIGCSYFYRDLRRRRCGTLYDEPPSEPPTIDQALRFEEERITHRSLRTVFPKQHKKWMRKRVKLVNARTVVPIWFWRLVEGQRRTPYSHERPLHNVPWGVGFNSLRKTLSSCYGECKKMNQ